MTTREKKIRAGMYDTCDLCGDKLVWQLMRDKSGFFIGTQCSHRGIVGKTPYYRNASRAKRVANNWYLALMSEHDVRC